MTLAAEILVGLGVLASWLGVLGFFRLRTPFERLHAVTFINVVAGTPVVAAACLTDGMSPRALKCLFIWLATLPIGALLSHVTSRSLHFREGERR